MYRSLSVFKKGDIVQHYKGGYYRILEYAKHTETEENMVIYRAVHYQLDDPLPTDKDQQIWARPQNMFEDKTKINGLIRDRFTKISQTEQ